MSKTIDERVVEMRFDNKQFESNVATSMSTLDKLKQKLNLSGASKGLENIDSASKKVNMNGLGSAVDAVKIKFSALEVMGVTALANITNSAVNTGKRMISALTIDPIKSGLQEYETQINAVQTILANTSSKGTTIDQVNAALDELNKYADLTIYNFTEMTRNIGTFTAAGIDLETSVSAIQGIANLAAVSGSTSQQASVAMYQLSQALASGTVKLMDWNSVVNAGMGGQVFQDALKETSKLLGTGAEAAIKAKGSFRESLTTGWLTAEVLTETLKKFTTSGANEYVAKYTGLSVDAVQAALDNAKAQYGEADAIDKAAEALAEKSGKSKEEIKNALQMARTAEDAATKVKTFSQLWDVLKEAAQSGWSKTWQIIIGDFEEAKALLTPLADFLTNIIGKFSDARNNLLESALGKSFSSLSEKIKGTLNPINKVIDGTKKVAQTFDKTTEALGNLDKIVGRVIYGDFGNGKDRYDKLTKAGENYYRIQNKVNEAVGDSFRYTDEQVAAQDKLLGKQVEMTKTTSEMTKVTSDAAEETANSKEETEKLTDAQKKQIKELAKLSDEQLRSKGYTEEQIKAFAELRETAEKLGLPLDDFIDNLDEINGRWLLINSFKNIGQALIKVFSAIGKAWREVFSPIQSDQVFNIIAAINKFTASLIPSEENVKLLTRTFKGLFAVLDIIKTVLGGAFRIAFKIASEVLSYFDLNILDVTAAIGDALVAFHDWFESIFNISGILNKVVPIIQKAISAVRNWFAAFKETPAVQKFLNVIESIKEAFRKLNAGEINIGEFAASLGKNLAKALRSIPGIALQIGKDFIAGFQNGISDKISGVIGNIINFCKNFISAFASALGVHSPSWIAEDIAGDFFQGFINGAKNAVSGVIGVLKQIAASIVKVFKSLWDFLTDESGNIEWGKLFAGGSIIAGIMVIKKLADAFSAISNAFNGIGDILSQVANTLKHFTKVLDGIAWDLKAKALLKMAIAIGVLALAVYLIAQIDDYGKLWDAVGVITVLGAVLVGLSIAMNRLSSASIGVNKEAKKLEMKGVVSSVLQIGLVLLAVAAAVKIVGSMKPEEAERGLKSIAGIMVGLLVFVAALGGISRYSGDANSLGKMMKNMAISMLLMILVCKLAGELSAEQMLKGALFAAGFAIFVRSIAVAVKGSDKYVNKIGSLMIRLSIAMLLMVGVCKLAGALSAEEMFKGAAFAAAFVIFVKYLIKVTKVGSEDKFAKIGGMIFSVSLSLLMLVGVCKLVGKLSKEEMGKGGAFVLAFLVLVKVLVKILTITNEQKMAKIAGTLIAMSVAIAVLAGVCILLGFVDIPSLAKGITAVGLLSLMMTMMIKGLKGAQNVKGSIIAMAAAIAIMAASIVVLSFIDTDKLIAAAGAMTLIMSAFALIIRSMKGLKKVPIAPILALTGVMIVMAGIIYILQDIDPSAAIGSAISLAVLMLTMAGVLPLVSLVGKMTGNALKGVIALTAMAVPMLAFVGVLALMSGIEGATDKVIALTALAVACTLLLIPLTIIGAIATTGIGAAAIGLGILALTAMAVPMLAFVGVLALMSGIENATSNAKLLTDMMLVIGDLLIKISLLAPLAVIGVAAMTGLTLLMGVIGVMAVAIGALMEKFPSIQKFLDTGLPVLEQLAGSIGRMVGNFIGGIGEGLGNSLVKIGDDIAKFMSKLSEASDNASSIKGESFNGVKQLMLVMAEIGGTSILTGITDLFSTLLSGEDSMDKFVSDAKTFFNGMKEAVAPLDGVTFNEQGMNAIITAAERLSQLQNSLESIGGVMTWFAGRDDLGTFGENVASFIGSMKTAFTSLDGVEFNIIALNQIIIAASMLAKLQSSIEPIGGVISWFKGRDDLGAFGYSIASFITSMKIAFMSLDGAEFNTAALNQIIIAASMLAKLQSSIEPIGGVISWFTGRDDLGTFGQNVASFITSMKIAFMSLDGAEFNTAALNQIIIAASMLAKLQSSIEPIGGVISWFTGRDDLGTFGQNVASFITSMKTAFSSLDGVEFNTAAINQIIIASTMLARLQGSLDSVGGVVDWFTGRDDLGTFGTNAASFITSMKTAMESLGDSEYNVAAMDSIIQAATKLATLQSNLDSVGGVVDWFTGRDDLGTFGENIGLFADAMKKLKDGMGEDGISEDVVASVIHAGESIVSLQKALPEEGWFDGKMDLSEFADYVSDFSTAMGEFGEKASGIDSGSVSLAIATAYRIKTLITSLADFDIDGLDTFIDDGVDELGEAMSDFGDEVKDIDTTAVEVAVSAASKLKTLISGLVNLDTSGVSKFKPQPIAEQIKGYADKVKEINTGKLSASITAAIKLKAFVAGLSSFDSSGVSKFKVGPIGSALKAYGNTVVETNFGAVSRSVIVAAQLKNFVSGLSGMNTSGVTSFKTAINQLATTNVAGVVKAFSGASTKLVSAGANMINGLIRGMQNRLPAVKIIATRLVSMVSSSLKSKIPAFMQAGQMMASKLASGITSKSGLVKSSVSKCLTGAVTRIRDKYNSFKNAGSYLVTGFCKGITENTWKAEAKARAMAKAAIDAAKDELDINSPSKVFKKIGAGIPEGFALGIGMLGGEVKDSVTSMASTAITSTKKAMGSVLDALSADMDTQPTIRPVVDLSDVQTGVNAIGGLFADTKTINVRSNLNAINSAMNRKLQNGSNDDIISAINKLNDGLENNRGDTYNFGGITYDDGSGISDAVQTLVRAARMGRRV